MKFPSRILALLLAVSLPAYSQLPGPAPIDYETARLSRIATAVRTTDDIVLDGHLEEASWQTAIPATDFITKLPREGRPSAERTEARFLYDDDNLYVGFTSYDSDIAHMVINELKEDFNFAQNDLVTITI